MASQPTIVMAANLLAIAANVLALALLSLFQLTRLPTEVKEWNTNLQSANANQRF